MSLDVIVWLLAGVGLGVAASAMLLGAFAGLERLRLGRRLKRARALKAVPSAFAAAAPAPGRPAAAIARLQPNVAGKSDPASGTAGQGRAKVVPLARKKDIETPTKPAEDEAGPAAMGSSIGSGATAPGVEPGPATEVVSIERTEVPPRPQGAAEPGAGPERQPGPVADAAAMQQVEGSARSRADTARPAPVAMPAPLQPPQKAEPKSVEALFAEAFARDRLVVPGDEGSKP
ncbi:hypothetical protein [Devosia sp.]|uniref:hypothetical protein n=1 Tax=Devosia sp. TaxID=1871048 RepID=UPI001ACD01CF|nr:hypothetical protein [Devosia sp.]MBN9308033.1 hypothetical protein [Devosia sp.]